MSRLCRRGADMFVVVAVVLFIIGGFNILQYRNALKSFERVEARIVDFYQTPPLNGFHSTNYPVFEYEFEGKRYRCEYRYQANDISELKELQDGNVLKDGVVKDILAKTIENQSEFEKDGVYRILVDGNRPENFYLEGQWITFHEMKWFVFGFVIILFDVVFKMIARFVG